MNDTCYTNYYTYIKISIKKREKKEPSHKTHNLRVRLSENRRQRAFSSLIPPHPPVSFSAA